MNQNSKEFEKNSAAAAENFCAVIARAAEEEMLKECSLCELKAGDIRIPLKTEAQILTLAGKLEKSQLNTVSALKSDKNNTSFCNL